jgi:3-oxoacyl-[acyl-carrier protein] reductase
MAVPLPTVSVKKTSNIERKDVNLTAAEPSSRRKGEEHVSSAAQTRAKPDLSNMAVIVTGGARGMGRAMTLGLANAGVGVIAADLASSRPEMDELKKAAGLQGVQDRIVFVDCDVTQWRDCENAVKSARERFGAVHGLVNNAGIGMQGFGHVQVGPRKRFYEHDPEAWRKAIDTNVNGPFMMAKAVAPALVAQGWGRIVNVVTSHFTMVMEGFSPYGPSKAALEAATVIWSRDLADTGVTVNALLPGGPGNTRMIPVDEVPDRSKLVQPEVMIAPIVWLMSPQSDGVTGRRFIAKEWDPALAASAAVARAGAPAGW